ncbi:MAG: biotin--[acetyl-CoA-carboxylase] ligase [Actinomycetota bacterium]|nr:biotin--[acetyl-CoA-carboxylase] ligase [Actinomycetota bacterium]
MTAADLSKETVSAALTGSFGRHLRVHGSVTSTNDEALTWADAGAPEGAVVVADYQTEGRGRWSRTWLSPPGSALMFSLVLRPAGPEVAALLTTALGVAVAEAIERAAGLAAGVKWPNDVVVRGKKAVGILVEARSSGETPGAVAAGIGMNVSWSPDEMPEEIRASSTSLQSAGAGPLPRGALLAEVLGAIERWYALLSEPEGRARVVDAATARSTILGHPVVLRYGDGSLLEGKAVRLRDDGALELERDGATIAVTAGEVERVRAGD